MSLQTFMDRFRFNSRLASFVGVEREAFIIEDGKIVPSAVRLLRHLEAGPDCLPDEFSYELSACQIESRTGPVRLEGLSRALGATEQRLVRGVKDLGLGLLHAEVGPADMPLDVYPDPTGRYAEIAGRLTADELLAGCRVVGTHVHIGMPNHKTALRVYNYLCDNLDELCEMGNGSFGERLAIYRKMAPRWQPRIFYSWEDYYLDARCHGYEDDPRQCWSIIRMSVHGTIEFRMFGATESIPRIVKWAARCRKLCSEGKRAPMPERKWSDRDEMGYFV